MILACVHMNHSTDALHPSDRVASCVHLQGRSANNKRNHNHGDATVVLALTPTIISNSMIHDFRHSGNIQSMRLPCSLMGGSKRSEPGLGTSILAFEGVILALLFRFISNTPCRHFQGQFLAVLILGLHSSYHSTYPANTLKEGS
jgi:hypothetical protein